MTLIRALPPINENERPRNAGVREQLRQLEMWPAKKYRSCSSWPMRALPLLWPATTCWGWRGTWGWMGMR